MCMIRVFNCMTMYSLLDLSNADCGNEFCREKCMGPRGRRFVVVAYDAVDNMDVVDVDDFGAQVVLLQMVSCSDAGASLICLGGSSCVISHLGRHARAEEARTVFTRMLARGVHPNLVVYNALMSAFARDGQWARAVEAFSDMQREGLAPDRTSYNTLVSALGRGGETQRAAAACAEMKAAGLTPDHVTFSALVRCARRRGNRCRALG